MMDIVGQVLIDQLLGYDVPVFVFDMHGEYVGADFPNGDVNVIRPKLNPTYMSFPEIKRLVNIPSNGYIQERHFRKAFNAARNQVRDSTAHTNNFLQLVYDILEAESKEEGSDKQIIDVMNKIEDSMDKYSNLFDNGIGNILTNIKIGHVNVLDLSQSDESVANVLVSHVMRNSLQKRKNAVHGLRGGREHRGHRAPRTHRHHRRGFREGEEHRPSRGDGALYPNRRAHEYLWAGGAGAGRRSEIKKLAVVVAAAFPVRGKSRNQEYFCRLRLRRRLFLLRVGLGCCSIKSK